MRKEYPSDIKKIVNWYNMLESKGLVDEELFEEETSVVEMLKL
jgi:hypothetical protein